MATFSSGVPMVKIDGEKVKSLREVRGLTQLYLATAVEVTTDTISRWENKRYPQIKKENALRLAEALEVPLEDILERHEEQELEIQAEPDSGGKEEGDARLREAAPLLPVAPGRNRAGVFAIIGVIFFALSLYFWSRLPSGKEEISAFRVAPDHVVPGQPFPVVVKINTGPEASSFILKERIPPQCVLVDGRSSGAVVDLKSGEIKWITKAKAPVVRVGYMLQLRDDFDGKDTINYLGSITQRTVKGGGGSIAGRKSTSASKYHWADSDANGVIDDGEILAVYDDYNEIDGLSLDMEEIEDIWFGSSYEWDVAKKEFVVSY